MIDSKQRNRLAAVLALTEVPDVGTIRAARLVRQFGSAEAVFDATISQLEVCDSISRSIASQIVSFDGHERARQQASVVAQKGWGTLVFGEPDYPEPLSRMSDPPLVLFTIGDHARLAGPMIAIVGTRRPTDAGRRFAQQLAKELAERRITVVSGMAEGIDTAAHKGALSAGGSTIAVWGTPLDVVFPQVNRGLAIEIAQHGLLLSEYLPGNNTAKFNFPERNRIISGLSEGVVVVEAGEKSGALITATTAREQNRELFAVPGSPLSAQSLGCNRLIKHGARLLTGADDIFDELPRLRGTVTARSYEALPDLTDTERQMITLLAEGPMQIDQLVRATNLSMAELMEFLLALELKGLILELAGKRFVLASQG